MLDGGGRDGRRIGRRDGEKEDGGTEGWTGSQDFQFLGFSRDLYLVNNSFPSNNPPDQNVISPSTRSTVETIILTFLSIAKNGMTGMAKNNGTDTRIRVMPTLNLIDFFINQYFDYNPFQLVANEGERSVNPFPLVANEGKQGCKRGGASAYFKPAFFSLASPNTPR